MIRERHFSVASFDCCNNHKGNNSKMAAISMHPKKRKKMTGMEGERPPMPPVHLGPSGLYRYIETCFDLMKLLVRSVLTLIEARAGLPATAITHCSAIVIACIFAFQHDRSAIQSGT